MDVACGVLGIELSDISWYFNLSDLWAFVAMVICEFLAHDKGLSHTKCGEFSAEVDPGSQIGT